MRDYKKSIRLATAAMMNMVARSQLLQAAVLHNARQDQIEDMRRQMHDVLDAYMDRNIEAAVDIRAMTET